MDLKLSDMHQFQSPKLKYCMIYEFAFKWMNNSPLTLLFQGEHYCFIDFFFFAVSIFKLL